MNDAVKYLEQLLTQEVTLRECTAESIAAIVTAIALAKLASCVKSDPDGTGYFDVSATTKEP